MTAGQAGLAWQAIAFQPRFPTRHRCHGRWCRVNMVTLRAPWQSKHRGWMPLDVPLGLLVVLDSDIRMFPRPGCLDSTLASEVLPWPFTPELLPQID